MATPPRLSEDNPSKVNCRSHFLSFFVLRAPGRCFFQGCFDDDTVVLQALLNFGDDNYHRDIFCISDAAE